MGAQQGIWCGHSDPIRRLFPASPETAAAHLIAGSVIHSVMTMLFWHRHVGWLVVLVVRGAVPGFVTSFGTVVASLNNGSSSSPFTVMLSLPQSRNSRRPFDSGHEPMYVPDDIALVLFYRLRIPLLYHGLLVEHLVPSSRAGPRGRRLPAAGRHSIAQTHTPTLQRYASTRTTIQIKLFVRLRSSRYPHLSLTPRPESFTHSLHPLQSTIPGCTFQLVEQPCMLAPSQTAHRSRRATGAILCLARWTLSKSRPHWKWRTERVGEQLARNVHSLRGSAGLGRLQLQLR